MHDALTGKRVLVTQAVEFAGPALCEVFTGQGAQVLANSADLTETGTAEKIGAETGPVAAGARRWPRMTSNLGP